MTLEEKNETLREMGDCIQKAKKLFDSGKSRFSVGVGKWKIEFGEASRVSGKSPKGSVSQSEKDVIGWAFALADSVVAGDYNLPKAMNYAINNLQDAVWRLAAADREMAEVYRLATRPPAAKLKG